MSTILISRQPKPEQNILQEKFFKETGLEGMESYSTNTWEELAGLSWVLLDNEEDF